MVIAEALVTLLKEKKLKISFAESCTGGLMASTIVDVSGASSVFEYGFVTYSAEAKINMLGVSEETIKKFGVVSCETAKEMVVGVSQRASSDVAISVTGCAGPGKDTDGNEEGTICFGFCLNGNVISEKMHIEGKSRNKIRKNAVEYAFNRIIHFINRS